MEKMYIYQIFISKGVKELGTFNTLKEVTNQVEYFKEMGFTHIMSNPILKSPDDCWHGYHIMDFFNIDPKIGSMEDFKELLDTLKKYNMSFIFDFTFNHTSTLHPWYIDFKKGLNDFYIAKDWKENDYGTDMNPSIYAWDNDINKFVVAPFGGFLPALNVESEGVKKEIEKAIKFWCEFADNLHFRADAVYHNRATRHDRNEIPYAQFIRDCVDKYGGTDRQIIGEVWTNWRQLENPIPMSYTLGNVFNFAGTFDVVRQINEGKKFEEINVLNPYKRSVLFLGSHDTSRIASMLGNDINKVKLFIKVAIEKSDCDFSFYYGGESMYEGHVFDGKHEPVRQNFDLIDMAKNIRDKNSLFYFIKDEIEKDKQKYIDYENQL